MVLGSPGADEFFYIDNGGLERRGPFNSAIVWSVDMGSNTVGGFDEVDIYGADDGSNEDAITLTDGGFTMNGATGTWLGVEDSLVRGFDGDDVLDGSALSTSSRSSTPVPVTTGWRSARRPCFRSPWASAMRVAEAPTSTR